MRFRGLDLNLLAVFAVLMEEQNVTRAAKRLHLTQPSISGALGRLREFFRDPLLVPQGRRMVPTALAETLTPQVAEILRSVSLVVDNAATFNPATTRRSFRISASDYISNVVLQPLMQRLNTQAPGMSLVIETSGERASARLEEGQIDLLVTPEEFASPRHPAETLLEEAHVVVGWTGNPAFNGAISEEDFTMLDHVTVLVGTDMPAAFAERHLEQLGRKRKVGLTVPHFSSVPGMVCETMRIGLMHKRLAERMSKYLPLALSPIPFPFPTMREVVQHHRARSSDIALKWFRGEMLICASERS